MNIVSELQTKKYVAYIDALGFKEMVREKGEKLEKYFITLSEAIEDINQDKKRIKSQLISDSTILSCDLTNEDLRLLLKAVQTIQSRLALQNIWVRGAISIGDIYFHPTLNIVVGNGLTDAYLLEMQEKLPRVIIDPRIVKTTFGNKNDFIKEFNIWTSTPDIPDIKMIPLIHDTRSPQKYVIDDALFVSFAERIIIDNINNVEIIYSHIQSELYNGQINYQKYLWLKNYFFQTLETIDISYFQHQRKEEINEILNKRDFYWGKFGSL